MLSEVRRVLRVGAPIVVTEVQNASFFVDPYSPNTMAYWMAFNDHQVELGGDPFVGAKLGNLLQAVGYRDVTTKIRTAFLDNRAPGERAEFLEFWTELLLSAAPGLLEAGKVTVETVEAMKEEMARVAHDPNSVFYYSFVAGARARVVSARRAAPHPIATKKPSRAKRSNQAETRASSASAGASARARARSIAAADRLARGERREQLVLVGRQPVALHAVAQAVDREPLLARRGERDRLALPGGAQARVVVVQREAEAAQLEAGRELQARGCEARGVEPRQPRGVEHLAPLDARAVEDLQDGPLELGQVGQQVGPVRPGLGPGAGPRGPRAGEEGRQSGAERVERPVRRRVLLEVGAREGREALRAERAAQRRVLRSRHSTSRST